MMNFETTGTKSCVDVVQAVTLCQEVVQRTWLSVERRPHGLVTGDQFRRTAVPDAAARIVNAPRFIVDLHLRREIGEVKQRPCCGDGKSTLRIKAEKIDARRAADRHVRPDIEFREF